MELIAGYINDDKDLKQNARTIRGFFPPTYPFASSSSRKAGVGDYVALKS